MTRMRKIGLIAVALFLAAVLFWRFLAPAPARLPVGPIESTWLTPEVKPGEAAIEMPALVEKPLDHSVKTAVSGPDIRPLFDDIHYPIASGALVSGDFAGGPIRAEKGVLYGVDFPELYCRAAAFSKGREMPKPPVSREQSFERMSFELTRSPAAIHVDSLNVEQGPFVLTGDLASGRGVLWGHLTLSLRDRWTHPCGVDENWRHVALPLKCEAPKGQPLSCALELKKLIESITGVAAKATEEKQKVEIKKLEQDVRKEREKFFKNRVKERPVMEEHDLRPLFVP